MTGVLLVSSHVVSALCARSYKRMHAPAGLEEESSSFPCLPLRWMAEALETQAGRSMQSLRSGSYVFSLCFPVGHAMDGRQQQGVRADRASGSILPQTASDGRTGVEDEDHVVDGDGGLGDVGRQHDLAEALRRGVEDLALLVHGQLRVQGVQPPARRLLLLLFARVCVRCNEPNKGDRQDDDEAKDEGCNETQTHPPLLSSIIHVPLMVCPGPFFSFLRFFLPPILLKPTCRIWARLWWSLLMSSHPGKNTSTAPGPSSSSMRRMSSVRTCMHACLWWWWWCCENGDDEMNNSESPVGTQAHTPPLLFITPPPPPPR